MACPSDPEIERPKNFVESISGDMTWEKYGIRIKWTEPVVPGSVKMPVNEPFILKLCVELKRGCGITPDALSAWCWTHIRSEENKCGIWREIRLHLNKKILLKDRFGNTNHLFESSVVPTANDLYRLTFNVKYNKIMIWANYFQVDNMVDVHAKPSVGTQYDHIGGPNRWRALFANMPQTISFYAQYFSNLFSLDSLCPQPATSGHPSSVGGDETNGKVKIYLGMTGGRNDEEVEKTGERNDEEVEKTGERNDDKDGKIWNDIKRINKKNRTALKHEVPRFTEP